MISDKKTLFGTYHKFRSSRGLFDIESSDLWEQQLSLVSWKCGYSDTEKQAKTNKKHQRLFTYAHRWIRVHDVSTIGRHTSRAPL